MFTRPKNYSTDETIRPGDRNGLRRFAPVMVLVVLAPVVAEVIFGATPLTNPGALLPDAAVYGCGALLIRELVRRRGLGWPSILMLGVAFGIVEEGLALQSLFNPNLFNAGDLGGHALGVNWVWTQWTLGYHAVWSISIPILLSELLFPARSSEPWLGPVGLWISGAVYVLGVAFFAVIFRLVVAPGFAAPASGIGGAALLALGLVALGLHWSSGSSAYGQPGLAREAHSPWLVGFLASLAAGAWFVPLLDLPDVLRTGAWVLAPMLLAAAPVAVVAALVVQWSGPDRTWTDLHRLALAMGALPVSMFYGFFYVTAGSPVDRAGQAVASALAVLLLGIFARRLRKRASEVGAAR
jgi:hypothetical protein